MRSHSVFSSRVRLACAAALATVALGCSNGAAAPNTDPAGNGNAGGTLEVTAANRSLTLRNTTEQVVTYFVFEKETLILATIPPPCGSQITRLAQAEKVLIPYSEIVGYSDKATEAAVFWCALTRSADGTFKPLGTMQSKIVRL